MPANLELSSEVHPGRKICVLLKEITNQVLVLFFVLLEIVGSLLSKFEIKQLFKFSAVLGCCFKGGFGI